MKKAVKYLPFMLIVTAVCAAACAAGTMRSDHR